MTQSEIISQTEQYVLHTYNRFPVALDRGNGMRVWDTEGRSYLDFMSGIGVYALGYHYPGYDEALTAQLQKTLHTSNLYYHEPLAEAARKLVTSAGLDKVFFTNSGAEAIEGAIKAARKYSFAKYGPGRSGIIAMNDSFHGRTVGAVSVTGNEHYQEPFRPLMQGVSFAAYNSISGVRELLSDQTCAVILETLQGEGGIFPAEKACLKELRALCTERDIVLILDEVQCGMGRTGHMWAYEAYGIKPDILCCAKALGCGVPVGAFVLSEKISSSSLAAGDHGSTYGGNPFVTAAVSTVFDLFESGGIVRHVRDTAPYLEEQLDRLKDSYGFITEHRGAGFMRGLELDPSVPAGKVAARALEKGLLIITAGHNVLRFLPPLIAGKDEIDEAAGILAACFDEAAEGNL